MANAKLPGELAAWLADHHGVVATSTIRSFGIGRKARDRLLDSGILRPVTRGVFVVATAKPTLEHRCAVVCAAHPSGIVTGPTAGSLAGLRRQPPAAVQFSSLHGRHLEPIAGVRFRQTTKLAEVDRRRRADGIVVASWPRLAFDLAGDLRQLDHRSVVQQLLERRLLSEDALFEIGRRLCHPARRGSLTFQRTLGRLTGTAQHSDSEVVLRELLLARGIPVIPQVPVTNDDGVTFHLDLGVPDARWGVELDIHPEHRSVEGAGRDSRRLRSLHVAGWQIEPVSELDMFRPSNVADELASLYRHRLADTRVPGGHPGGH